MFNTHSRWDRHLPYDPTEAESLEVGVIFRKGQAHPKWFVWKGRRYAVKATTFRWQDKRGTEKLHLFSVTDGINLYQIHFNPSLMHWRLEKICPA